MTHCLDQPSALSYLNYIFSHLKLSRYHETQLFLGISKIAKFNSQGIVNLTIQLSSFNFGLQTLIALIHYIACTRPSKV